MALPFSIRRRIHTFIAITALAGTPQPIVDKLARLIADAAKAPDIKAKLTTQGAIANHSSPAALATHAKNERKRSGNIIKSRNLAQQ